MESLTGFLGPTYLWVKAAHVVFVIFLMAGLFMLPRFFVYHQESAPGSAEEAQWITREDKLRTIILNPALFLVWLFGLMLMAHLGAWREGWFHVKLLVVLLLSGYHGWAIGYMKKLKRGERPLSGKTLRLVNEAPGILAVIAVIMVVVRPF